MSPGRHGADFVEGTRERGGTDHPRRRRDEKADPKEGSVGAKKTRLPSTVANEANDTANGPVLRSPRSRSAANCTRVVIANEKSRREAGSYLLWRRERDSNPRYGYKPYNALAGRPLRPLGHLSKYYVCSSTTNPASLTAVGRPKAAPGRPPCSVARASRHAGPLGHLSNTTFVLPLQILLH